MVYQYDESHSLPPEGLRVRLLLDGWRDVRNHGVGVGLQATRGPGVNANPRPATKPQCLSPFPRL